MNPLLIRRRGMMQAQQGGLPYDSKVEYLESTGTQWIDLGVKIDTEIDVSLTFIPTADQGGYSVGIGIFGTRDGVNSRNISCYYTNSVVFCDYNSGSYAPYRALVSGSPIGKVLVFNLSKYRREITVNGVTTSNTTTYPSSFSEIQNARLLWVSGSDGAYSAKAIGKLYQFSITGLMQLIPVRVGTTGYMYDQVSGQLFGNLGTGNFILGPDVQ